MVYFAYGFPAQYRLSSTQESNRDEEEVVSSQWSTDLLLIVTKRNIHIWSGGQHRVKLGWLERKKEDVGTYGWHKDVAWLPSRKLLAVTVGIYVAKEYTVIVEEHAVMIHVESCTLCYVDGKGVPAVLFLQTKRKPELE